MINRDFPNHDVKENVKDFPNHELCRVIVVQKQYPFDQNNCTSIQTIAAHFEQLLLTENKSNHGESGKISFSYTTDVSEIILEKKDLPVQSFPSWSGLASSSGCSGRLQNLVFGPDPDAIGRLIDNGRNRSIH